MGGSNELSPEENQLLAKQALLLERKKQLEELERRCKQIQQERKQRGQNSAVIAAAETPSQATEIAKKLAASGKLVTTQVGTKTSGFKRTIRSYTTNAKDETSLPKTVNPDVKNEGGAGLTFGEEGKEGGHKSDIEDSIENDAAVDSIMNTLRGNNESTTNESNVGTKRTFKHPKTQNHGPQPNKKPRINFVKSSNQPLLEDETRDVDSEVSQSMAPKIPRHFASSDKTGDKKQPLFKMEAKKHLDNVDGPQKAQNKGNTIFIRNVGLTEPVVRRLVEPFGEIYKIDFDQAQKVFATFTTIESAEKAIKSLHGFQLTEENFDNDITAMAKCRELTLHVVFAKKQRHINIAKDLKHDWSRISASASTLDSLCKKRDRVMKVYDDEPF